jgi:transcriptional regulator with GAF, ATPase, and Fis domain
MNYRRRKIQDANPRQDSLVSHGESDRDTANAIKSKFILIGGNAGPKTKYFHRDSAGNIHLADSFDPVDPWWGLTNLRYSDDPTIVGRTSVMLEVFNLIEKLTFPDVSVLIEGPTGTGKEAAARAIASTKLKFIPLNCAGLADTLLESELFGHIKGSFTGAINDRIGVFEAADKGTLFLDEIGDMPLNMQAKLLRVLGNGVIMPVGSNKPVTVNVRLICASNQPLWPLVKQGNFRADLYARICTVPLYLPPLYKRKEDIPFLTAYFLLKKRARFSRNITTIPFKTVERLCAYNWPLNIRELEHIIEKALIIGDGPVFQPDEIIFNIPSVFDTGLNIHGLESSDNTVPNHFCQATAFKRTAKIMGLLQQKPGATVKNVLPDFNCSVRTIQRDMRKLLQNNKVISKRDGHEIKYYIFDTAQIE